MIAFVRGQLVEKGEALGGGLYLVVDVQGLGYRLLTSTATFQRLPEADAPVLCHTSLIVREDAMQLVGFLTMAERAMFELLSSASGVGPKVALALLSDLSVSDLAGAILSGDYKRLTVAKGVGPKLAQKLTIELKDKMGKWQETRLGGDGLGLDSRGGPAQGLPESPAYGEAEAVLLSLGYERQEIFAGLRHLSESRPESAAMSSEEVLQAVLKWLATHPVH